MDLIVEGKTNKQIARALHRSENTVKIHRARVMRKMHANTAAHLVRMALSIARDPKDPTTDTDFSE